MGAILSLVNPDYSSLISYFLCYIGNYFGNCRIYNHKMKTDLKTGSYHNGSATEPCWTVPDSPSTTCPYGYENKENSVNLYNSVGYTSNNKIILHNQKNEFIHNGKNGTDYPDKTPERFKNGLKIQYQPSDFITPTKNTSPTGDINRQIKTATFSSSMTCTTRSTNSQDVAASCSNILNGMAVKEIENRPVNNTRCPNDNSRQWQQNGAPKSSFTQLLQKNIQEAVRNFSWWTSGYVHENPNSFYSSRTAPCMGHLCCRSSPRLDYYYRPVKEMGYPCQANYMPTFCYNPDRHCPQPLKRKHPRFCVASCPIVGQAGYPGSNYKKGDGRATKRATYPNQYISKSDWSKSNITSAKNQKLFEKTHWFSETAKENYKLNEATKVPSVQKGNFATKKRIEVYSLQPKVTSTMSPVTSDSPLPSTLYSNHQEEPHNHEKAKTCDTPETANFPTIFSPARVATSGDLAANSRQMLDLPQVANQNEEDGLETGPVVCDGVTSFSDMVVNCSPSSEDDTNDCVVKERDQDSFSEEEEERSDDGESDVDICRCPSPHRCSGLAHCYSASSSVDTDEEENDSDSEVESDSDSDDDDLEIDGLASSENSEDDLEIDGVAASENSEDDLEIDGVAASEDDLETDGGPVDLDICSMASWLIKPDTDSEESSDEEEEEDVWNSTWSSTSAKPVLSNEIDLVDEFNHFTLKFSSCSPSDEEKADVPAVDEVEGGNSQKLKEANERWNKVYDDDDDDQGFTFDEENHPKKVQFARGKNLETLHLLVCWTYAYRAARKGPWINLSLDSERFRKRITELKSIIDPVLDPVHRHNVLTSRLQQAAENT